MPPGPCDQTLAMKAQLKVENQGGLLTNMVLFCRLLRRLGMDVTPTQVINLVGALKHINIGDRRDFRNVARTILINRQQHLTLFNRAFDLFWQAPGTTGSPFDLEVFLRKDKSLQRQPVWQDREEKEGEARGELENEPFEGEKRQTYSAREVLRHKDFSQLTREELEEVRQWIQTMTWGFKRRRTRRKIPGSTRVYLDMRRTLQQTLRQGGESLLLRWRRPKQKQRPLVLICDVSGSMEPYSRLLLRFVYVISRGLRQVEAFVFGTRLTRITHHLKGRDIDRILSQVTGSIRDWAGGTRIGESLKTFNYDWGRRVLGQGAVVLIISDGWDRGDISLLEKEMCRLQRSCQRLVWLNPLLGSPRYQPLTRGIQAALGYLDDFLPVHNLASLQQLGYLLEHLTEHRPLRRQSPRRFSELG